MTPAPTKTGGDAGTVRLACIADLHGELPPLGTACDMAIIAGDICPDLRPAQQLVWLSEMLRPWLETLPVREVIAVAGNHDRCWPSGKNARETYPQGLQPDPQLPWHWLCDRELSAHGLRVHGTPWVPWVAPGWNFQSKKHPTYGREFLRRRFELLAPGVDVLISHGPPFGAGDFCHAPTPDSVRFRTFDQWEWRHEGSPDLRHIILKRQPRLVVCGHIHHDRGAHRTDGFPMVVNCAAHDDTTTDRVLRPRPWWVIDMPVGAGEPLLIGEA